MLKKTFDRCSLKTSPPQERIAHREGTRAAAVREKERSDLAWGWRRLKLEDDWPNQQLNEEDKSAATEEGSHTVKEKRQAGCWNPRKKMMMKRLADGKDRFTKKKGKTKLKKEERKRNGSRANWKKKSQGYTA